MKTCPPTSHGDADAAPHPDIERDFRDLGEIGRGGMGSVRRVHDPRLLRDAAMKRLQPERASREGMMQRFVEEAQITGQLEHPNIPPVHELGVDRDRALYLNMKLVDGTNLRDVVEQQGPARLEPARLAELLSVLVKVCDAVAYAHSRGVVHLDIKPANVMVGDFGQVYLMDWGIARIYAPDMPNAVRISGERERGLDSPGTIIGTPAYMAPEQALGERPALDPRADVYALGGLLYYVLTATAPHGDVAPVKALRRAVRGEIAPIDEIVGAAAPPALARIAMRALATDPAARYPSALAFQEALQRFARGTWQLAVVRVPAGTDFLREGEPGQTAYIVRAGRCAAFSEVDGARRVLREMGPGDVFGETAVFTDAPRSASVVALTDLELLEVDRESLDLGLGLSSWMGDFVRALATRFRDVDAKLRGH